MMFCPTRNGLPWPKRAKKGDGEGEKDDMPDGKGAKKGSGASWHDIHWKRLKGKNPEGKNFRKLRRRKQSSAKISQISRNTLKSSVKVISSMFWEIFWNIFCEHVFSSAKFSEVFTLCVLTLWLFPDTSSQQDAKVSGPQKGPPLERGHVKTSKVVKKCQTYFRHFSTFFAQGKQRQKSSKSLKNVFDTFDNFRAAPVFRPLLGALIKSTPKA